ncbi:MAG: hypothetical protein LBP31_02380 [Holosporales bacterium]|jgi:lipopolysaccharide biosynthesis glycosyltransferase|nr:hypothetical protein [Holosporales bacterium]
MRKSILLSLIAVFLCVTNLSKAISRNIRLTKTIIINEVESSFIDLPGCQDIDISGPIVPWNRLKTCNPSEIINIVYVADRKYLPYTYTSLISILDNSKPEERKEPIRFTIVFDEIGFNGTLDDDMSGFLKVLFFKFNRDIYKYDIEYIPIPDRERERISKFKSYKWPKSIFLKLFFSDFLLHDKCLYIDGDTICIKDIRRLWNINLGEHCFGGTEYGNTFEQISSSYSGGLWLFDLSKMRGNNFVKKMEDILARRKLDLRGVFVEETALGQYIESHGVCEIGCEFNFPVSVMPKHFPKQITESEKTPTKRSSKIEKILRDLAIVHYDVKPLDCIQKYEAAGCPNYENTNNNFWRTIWKYNPLSFCMWHEYYKKYYEIRNFANPD